ncbi:Osmotin thaumatin-like protein [Trametes elegans]|nr:Osmotin thaumatin-like protein [Trametes elegans]
MQSFSALVALAFAAVASARTFTVVNHCSYTVWYIFTDLNVGSAIPDHPNGRAWWEQAAGQTVSFNVPNNWKAGRIWGRRGCDFSKTQGPNSCLDGGCNGGLVCDPHTGTGVPPVSLAEFTLGTNGTPDNYDVSLVDGSNIPISIQNNKKCAVADCPVDLNPKCPAPLAGPKDANGNVVGCKSACVAGLGDPTNNPNCCTGTHSTPQTCPSSGVQYYSYFKQNCPNAYAYAYDDATSLKTCDASLEADYTITFCP